MHCYTFIRVVLLNSMNFLFKDPFMLLIITPKIYTNNTVVVCNLVLKFKKINQFIFKFSQKNKCLQKTNPSEQYMGSYKYLP